METIFLKLIWFLIIAGAGVVFVVYRKVASAADKSYVTKTIKALRNNRAKAKEFVETLDIPYGKRENFSQEDFSKLKSALPTAAKIGEFIILYQTEVDVQQYLLITELEFSDFDITVSGDAEDIMKKAYHGFVLRFEPDNQALSVWSDIFNDTNAKFQKQAFTKGITR